MHLNFLLPPAWMDDAACAARPDDLLWFPSDAAPIRKEAKDTCRLCPVNLDCLAYAIDNNLEGFWAGTSHQQRKKLTQDGAA